jgi:hypothetical protein
MIAGSPVGRIIVNPPSLESVRRSRRRVKDNAPYPRSMSRSGRSELLSRQGLGDGGCSRLQRDYRLQAGSYRSNDPILCRPVAAEVTRLGLSQPVSASSRRLLRATGQEHAAVPGAGHSASVRVTGSPSLTSRLRPERSMWRAWSMRRPCWAVIAQFSKTTPSIRLSLRP